LEISKDHILGKSPSNLEISSYAQETMCYMGQQLVFSEASETLHYLLGCAINAKQIERVCHQYGSWIEEQEITEMEEKSYHIYPKEDQDQVHYAQMDGSMLLTREDGWKEIKLGRIYKHEDIAQINEDRRAVVASNYVAHLGSHTEFTPKMEYYLDGLKKVVFLADGAKWIWNWIEDTYPESIQILDFFHAKEHLCDFLKDYYNKQEERKVWIERFSKLMLGKDPNVYIKALEDLPAHSSVLVNQKKQTLLAYYAQNRKRMSYHAFLKEGLCIGSGAIEAAHKDVLQKRLKLSGQRWTCKGLQQMAQLRVVYKSDKWNKINELCRKAA
jgi:hypothetical protein